ncbi:pyocin activator PrtN family protein [Pseudomonas sp. MWU16-30317]|uniref:pyocin activator PrtN family protein n=1 Tax=Pseudomonas sp. MWU16-30317 TaxID=2878095 RepID=UPI0021AE06B6|nr:pyocin activator PrtN family protein [Pseudomonas sp. MWU16-30317]
MKLKVASGEIDFPLVRIEGSQKSARGVHLADLAQYIDMRAEEARAERDHLSS